MYAATFNTDTAVIYALLSTPDSRLDVADRDDSSQARMQMVADAVGMARRMTDDELEDLELLRAEADLAALSDTERAKCYVLVKSEEGELRQLSPKAAIWGKVDLAGPNADPDYTTLLESEQLLALDTQNKKSIHGLQLVRLYRDAGETQVQVNVYNNLGQVTGTEEKTIQEYDFISPPRYRLYVISQGDAG